MARCRTGEGHEVALRAGHIHGLAGLVRRFGRDEGGAIAVLFGIMIAVTLMMAAVAIDYSRFVNESFQDQYALDSAMLAASDAIGHENQDQEAEARAVAFYKANRPDGSRQDIAELTVDSASGVVRGKTAFDLKTTLLRAFGYEQTRLGTEAVVVRGGTAEVALVLDNSGSMAGTYIEDLKTAAESLADAVFSGVDGSGKIAVSIVPFAGSVNVGASFRGAAWLDNDGVSPVSRENAVDSRSRLQLFDDLGTAWGGCVEMRGEPYDASDAAADPETPETLFVPMFAPDEPDEKNDGGQSYANNYISDDGGDCPRQECTCAKWKSPGKCASSPGWVLTPIATGEAQARTCKYRGQQIGFSGSTGDKCSRGSFPGDGPNAYCTTQAILPLSVSKEQVVTAVRSMIAKGMTNIGEGLAWGWRTLSPDPPFTEGRAYADRENKKIIILMTDGQNTYTATSNHNKSRYGALGYAAPYAHPTSGRLGSTHTSAAFTTRMTQRTQAVCANAKAAGVKLYTVAFRLEDDPATLSLLRNCATETRDAYVASDGAALIEAFQNIGREIARLRIAG